MDQQKDKKALYKHLASEACLAKCTFYYYFPGHWWKLLGNGYSSKSRTSN